MMLTRRTFLAGGLQVTAALPLIRPALAGTTLGGKSIEKSLVIVQLSGGNDGLNMVVPSRQDAYYALRPTLALPRSGLQSLDGDFGLNPGMSGLADLYHEGAVACVHSVGYPNPNRSHFRSMEIWHTAAPDAPPSTVGWLGQLADQLSSRDPERMPAIHVGDDELPLALWGRKTHAPSVRTAESFRLHAKSERFADTRDRLLSREGSGQLDFLRNAAATSYEAAHKITELAERPSKTPYPDTALARKLKLVARFLSGRLGARIFQVELGGFDTHVRQARTHNRLLEELSGALAAFQANLESEGISGDVVTLVFSEFGRRVRENGSRGTDHGAGAPLLLVGSPVAGGMHGAAPDLDRLEEGDIPYSTDFRSVYTTLEADWLGLAPSTEFEAAGILTPG